MRKYILFLSVFLFLVTPVFGQTNSDVKQLELDNLNLQLRVMQLEYKELKAQRDRLAALIKQQGEQKKKVESQPKEKSEEE